MAQIHGKQLKDESLLLTKLDTDGGQGNYLFGSGTMLQITDAPTSGTDLANKDYVDSIAAGLDPKESVRVKTDGSNITLSGAQTLDGYSVANGDRVLVTDQSDQSENGIYVADTGGAWSRAEDADGTPDHEVSKGNFTFVEEGTQYGGTGWVLSGTNATDPTQINVGTDTQIWTQFSTQGVINAGAGLDKDGNTLSADLTPEGGLSFSTAGSGGTIEVVIGDGIELVDGAVSVDLAANSGLTFVGESLTVNETIAGDGLSWTDGVIDVNAGNGIEIVGDDVSVDLATDSGLTFVGLENDELSINPTIAGDGLSWTNGIIDVNAGTGIAIVNDDVTANSGAILTDNVLGLTSNINSVQDALQEIETQLNDLEGGTITEVLAGTGLTGGGDSGSVTLEVNAGTGIAITNDDITSNSDALLVGNVLGLTANVNSVQDALEAIDGDLNNRVGAQYVAGVNTTGDTNTAISLGFDPYNGSVVELYVNGQKQQYGSTNDYFFTSDGSTARAIDEVQSGDTLFWNGTIAGFDLSTDDDISIVSTELVA